MTTEERVMTLFAEANPVPDLDALDLVEVEAATYLATLSTRSSEMTKTQTPPSEERARRTPTAAIAVLAAAAVILGVALVLLNQSEETPPATDPAPVTTTIPGVTTVPTVADQTPPEVEERLAVATSFMAAWAAGDHAAMNQYAVEGHINLAFAGSLETAADDIAWREAVGWDITISGCDVTSPELTNFRVTCTATHENEWSRALGFGPYTGEFVMRVSETQLEEVLESPMVVESWGIFMGTNFIPEVWNPFLGWLDRNHPADVETMLFPPDVEDVTSFLTGVSKPKLTPESIALWEQYTAEFVAELG